MKRFFISRKIRTVSDRVLSKFFPDYLGENFICPICQTELSHFLPLPLYFLKELNKNQHIHSIFQNETLNIEDYACPKCYSSDRERLYALYFKKSVQENQQYKVLDFAPAPSLRKFIKSFPNIEYRSADLLMDNVDDKVDISDMKIYPDEKFDIFVCSHVLEHVPDDRKAMSELNRILSPNGWGIAMVPICLGLDEIYEDPNITDEGLRWKYFGQNDHLRMYSKQGFIERLENVGFLVNQFGIDYFGEEVFSLNGIHPRSVLYIVHKK
jgi:SAM-dependent methyltransferase